MEQGANRPHLPDAVDVQLQQGGLKRDEQQDGRQHPGYTPPAADAAHATQHRRRQRGHFEIVADIRAVRSRARRATPRPPRQREGR